MISDAFIPFLEVAGTALDGWGSPGWGECPTRGDRFGSLDVATAPRAHSVVLVVLVVVVVVVPNAACQSSANCWPSSPSARAAIADEASSSTR